MCAPGATSAFFLGTQDSRRSAWFSPTLQGLESGDQAVWRMSFIPVAYVMGDLGQVNIPELQFFLHVVGIWRPPRVAEVWVQCRAYQVASVSKCSLQRAREAVLGRSTLRSFAPPPPGTSQVALLSHP